MSLKLTYQWKGWEKAFGINDLGSANMILDMTIIYDGKVKKAMVVTEVIYESSIWKIRLIKLKKLILLLQGISDWVLSKVHQLKMIEMLCNNTLCVNSGNFDACTRQT